MRIIALVIALASIFGARLVHATVVSAPAELSTAVLPSPLHSRPDAPNVAYLDFTTYPSTATDEQIAAIWTIVAAAYAPFNLDVTTEFPGYRGNVAWSVIGGPLTDGHVGIAPLGAWTWGTQYAQYGTTFAAKVYADYYANDPTFVAQGIIHEDGHLFGLQHQLTGYMYPFIDPSQNFWSTGINEIGMYQDDVAVIGAATGFAVETPEPPVLLAVAGYLLMRRTRGVI